MFLVLAHLPAGAKAQQAFDSLFHQSYTVRSVYFDTVVTPQLSKLSAAGHWQALERLQERARKERDEGAMLELAIGKIEYKDMAGLIDLDEKINSLKRLLATLDKDRTPEYYAVVINYLAQNYYGKKHNYTRAFEYIISACQIATRFSQRDFPDKQLILMQSGNRYYAFGNYKKARQLLLEADSLRHPWNQALFYNTKNTLGLIYRANKQYDTAIYYFEQSRKHALGSGNRVWAAIISGNIGICYYLQRDYARAVPLLKEDIQYSLSPFSAAIDNGVNSLLILADIHLSQNDLPQVAADIQLAQQYLDSCRDKVKQMSMLYPVMATYYFKKGDYRTAYAYRDSAAVYKDSLQARDNIYMLALVEHKKDMERVDTEIKRLSAEKKLLSYTRNGLLIGILLLFIIAALIINRQRLKHHLKGMAILSKKVQAEHELKAATRQLEIYTRHLQEKNLLIEQSGNEIEKLRAALDTSYPQEGTADVLQQLYTATILTDEEWNSFKLLFEQVHKGYLHRLKEKMPELTPADTRFLVLSKLNLSNKEMAGILGVQPDTIRSYKHRLRRRFDLPEDANIKLFVDSI